MLRGQVECASGCGHFLNVGNEWHSWVVRGVSQGRILGACLGPTARV